MNKNTTMLAGTFALGAVIFAGSFMTTDAYRGDYSQKGPQYSEERHQAMTQAFENNDYDAWKAQMDGRGRVTQVITADNFAQFAEAHRLALAGDLDGADAIRAELGLRTRDGQGGGQGYGKGEGRGMRGGNMNCTQQ
jgi:hypothetical protein